MKGIGIDMIETERISRKLGKEAGFRELVFSPGEIAYCEKMAHPVEHYAARFAAKEAFFKALGTGWLKGTAFNEVEIVHDALGKPMIVLLGTTATTIAGMNVHHISVSLTHLKTIAAAVVMIEE